MFVITQERHGYFLLLCPGFLGKWIVAANPIDRRVKTGIRRKVGAHSAHFRSTRPGESHRKKEQQGVSLAEILAQSDLLRAVGGFRRQSEIRGLCTDRKCHRETVNFSIETAGVRAKDLPQRNGGAWRIDRSREMAIRSA